MAGWIFSCSCNSSAHTYQPSSNSTDSLGLRVMMTCPVYSCRCRHQWWCTVWRLCDDEDIGTQCHTFTLFIIKLSVRLTVKVTVGCLFGLAVECATARLSTRTGLIRFANQLDRTGYESCAGCEIRSGTYAIGLISWAASEGSTVSSLICDRWLTGKL